ncbi:MAG: hypothetical protein LLG08_03890 [Actinomycetia bacterium]|nr:hypothetical protein [Actinomycetes bacterium]
MNFYQNYRTELDWAGKRLTDEGDEHDQFNIRLIPSGVIPARTAEAALRIAKALGHPRPIVEPLAVWPAEQGAPS